MSSAAPAWAEPPTDERDMARVRDVYRGGGEQLIPLYIARGGRRAGASP